MSRMEQVFHTSICQYVYAKIQDFVQCDLREPLRASIKKKKEKMRTIISSIRATCADWKQGTPPPNDPCLRGEKDPKGGFQPDVPRRTVGPSSTQVFDFRIFFRISPLITAVILYTSDGREPARGQRRARRFE